VLNLLGGHAIMMLGVAGVSMALAGASVVFVREHTPDGH